MKSFSSVYSKMVALCFVWAFPLMLNAAISNPGISSPANGDTLNRHQPQVSNNNYSGATAYRFQVDTSALFNSPLLSDSTFKNRSGYSPLSYSYGQKLYFRSKVYTANDSSNWSNVHTCYIANRIQLQLPANKTVGNFSYVRWLGTGATAYQLQADTSLSFSSNLLYNKIVTNVNTYAIDSILFGKRYFWKVRSFFGSDTSEWSQVFQFTLNPDFLVESPKAGYNFRTFKSQWVIKWKYKMMASVQTQLSEDLSFSNVNEESNFDAGASLYGYFEKIDFNKELYTRMRVVNKLDTLSWYNGGNVLVNPSRIIGPNSGTTIRLYNEQLDLAGYSNYDSMHFQLALDTGFKQLVRDTYILNTNANFGTLDWNTKYYGRLRTLHYRDTTDWSPRFEWNTPNMKDKSASHLVPGKGQANIDPTMKFYPSSELWGADSIIVRLDSQPSLKNAQVYGFNSRFPNDGFNPTYLDFGTKYYYSFQVLHQDSVSEWSNIDSFVTWNGTSLTYNYPPNTARNWGVQNNLIIKPYYLKKGFEFYVWQLDTVNTFNSPVLLSDTSTNPNNIAVNKKHYLGQEYYWRVAVGHRNDTSEYSQVWNFQSHTTYLNEPKNNSTNLKAPLTFKWSTVYPGLKGFIFQLDTSMAFHSAEINIAGGDKNEYTISKLASSQQYYWRVKPYHELDTGIWSQVYTFSSVKIKELLKPFLNAPSNNAKDVSAGAVTFKWQAAGLPNTTTQLQVASNESFGNVLFNNKVSGSSTSITGFAYNRTYYWRVRYVRNDNENGPWSNTFNFTTEVDLSDEMDDKAALGFAVYPNPSVNGLFQLEVNHSVNYEITALDGRVIIQGQTNQKAELNLSDFDSGIYLLRIRSEAIMIEEKLIKL